MLIAIVADSGAGKSSLAQAGLIPAFRGGALADESRDEPDDKIWHVVVMRPGGDPVQGLKDGITDAAKLLGLSGAEQAQLRDRVNISDPGESAYALRCDLDRKKTETLLIIDQFEELLIQTPEDKRAFCRFSLRLDGWRRRAVRAREFCSMANIIASGSRSDMFGSDFRRRHVAKRVRSSGGEEFPHEESDKNCSWRHSRRRCCGRRVDLC
jgi:hypothetical protein